MQYKTLGDFFRERREEMNYNYCQIERYTGVPHDLIRRIEENRYNPRRLTLISINRLAEFYGFSARWVYNKLEEEIHDGN